MDPSRDSATKDVVPAQDASLVAQKRSAGAVASGPGAASVNRGKFSGLA